MMASDSIVVFSDGADRDGALKVVGSVYRLFREAIRLGMPLRGAISLGELDVVEVEDVAAPGDWTATVGGLVGLGLVRAHELERQFEWSGVVLDPAVVDVVVADIRERFGDSPEVDALIGPKIVPFLTEAVPPHRNPEDRRSAWVVDWATAIDDGLPRLTREWVSSAFESHGRSMSCSRARAKRDNTLAFWDSQLKH
jgi:hypothetical protein